MKQLLAVLALAVVATLVILSLGEDDSRAHLPTTDTVTPQEPTRLPVDAAEPEEELEALAPDADERRELERTDDSWHEGQIQWPAGNHESTDDLAVIAVPRAMDYASYLRWSHAEGESLSTYPVDESGQFRVPTGDDQESAWVIVRGKFAYSPEATDLSASGAAPILLELGAYLQGRLVSDVQGALSETTPMELSQASAQLDPLSMVGSRPFRPVTFDALEGGKFSFRALPAGTHYGLRAVHPYLTGDRVSLEPVIEGAQIEEVLTLVAGASVRGTVVDEAGAPVAEATVQVVSDGLLGSLGADSEREVQSDTKGQFLLRGLNPGEAKLLATAEGFLEGERHPLNLLATESVEGVTLTLRRGQSIRGSLHWADGRPAVETQVQANFDVAHAVGLGGINAMRGARSSTLTDEGGQFTLTGLGNGPFVVSASSEAALLQPGPGSDGSESVKWRAQASAVQPGTRGLDLVLEAPLAIAGRVVDETTAPVQRFAVHYARSSKGPAGGLSAKVSKRSKTVESDEGRFVIQDLAAGPYVAWVQDEEHASAEPVEFDVPLTEELELVVQATGRATGRVYGTDGTPIADAAVQTSHGTSLEELMAVGLEPANTTTDAEGRFDLKGIPAGSCQLIAEAEGWAKSPGVPVELAPAERIEGVRIEVPQGGTLTGEVFDSAGKLADGFLVTIVALDSVSSGAGLTQKLVTTDSAGAFEFTHLQAGTWQVTAIDTDKGLGGDADLGALMANIELSQAEILDGESTHVVLGAPPEDPVRLFGTITLGGEPFEGASLTLFPEGGQLYANLAMAAVEEDGTYELTLDGPGGYTANVQTIGAGPGQQSTTEYRLQIPAASEHRHDFELPLGRISGRVVGPDGRGISGERVTVTLDGDARSDRMFGGQYSELVSLEDGEFEVLPLRAGVYRVSAGGAPMFGMGEGHLGRVTLGGLILAEDQTLDGLVLELPEPGSILLTVVDPGGAPAGGAAIFVRDASGRILEPFSMQTTGAEGSALLKALAPGQYTLLTRTQDLCSAESAPLTVRANATSEMRLTLDVGTIVKVELQSKSTRDPVRGSVRVLDAAGRDYANLFGFQDLQYLYVEGGFSPTEHRFGPLPPGRYVVHGETSEGSAKKPVTLNGGERRVVLRLK